MRRQLTSTFREEEKDGPSALVIVVIIILLAASAYTLVTKSVSRFSEPEKGALVIGTNTPFPPFEYKQGQDITGFDIELASKIGEKTGRKVVIKDFSDFQSIFPAVETGSIDMAISGITITSQRDSVADFSEPYYNTSQALLSTKKADLNLPSNLTVGDFSKLRIGYQALTTSQTWAETNLKPKSNTTFDDLNMGLQSLRLGSFDGIVIDEAVANVLAKNYPDLVIEGVVKTDERYGVMVKEGDPQHLLPEVNQAIGEIKQNGEYDLMIKKYFGG